MFLFMGMFCCFVGFLVCRILIYSYIFMSFTKRRQQNLSVCVCVYICIYLYNTLERAGVLHLFFSSNCGEHGRVCGECYLIARGFNSGTTLSNRT